MSGFGGISGVVTVFGDIFTLVFILLLGVVARHLFGAEAVRLGERVLARVPIARSIYAGVKQLFAVVLDTYPRPIPAPIDHLRDPARAVPRVDETMLPGLDLAQEDLQDEPLRGRHVRVERGERDGARPGVVSGAPERPGEVGAVPRRPRRLVARPALQSGERAVDRLA